MANYDNKDIARQAELAMTGERSAAQGQGMSGHQQGQQGQGSGIMGQGERSLTGEQSGRSGMGADQGYARTGAHESGLGHSQGAQSGTGAGPAYESGSGRRDDVYDGQRAGGQQTYPSTSGYQQDPSSRGAMSGAQGYEQSGQDYSRSGGHPSGTSGQDYDRSGQTPQTGLSGHSGQQGYSSQSGVPGQQGYPTQSGQGGQSGLPGQQYSSESGQGYASQSGQQGYSSQTQPGQGHSSGFQGQGPDSRLTDTSAGYGDGTFAATKDLQPPSETVKVLPGTGHSNLGSGTYDQGYASGSQGQYGTTGTTGTHQQGIGTGTGLAAAGGVGLAGATVAATQHHGTHTGEHGSGPYISGSNTATGVHVPGAAGHTTEPSGTSMLDKMRHDPAHSATTSSSTGQHGTMGQKAEHKAEQKAGEGHQQKGGLMGKITGKLEEVVGKVTHHGSK